MTSDRTPKRLIDRIYTINSWLPQSVVRFGTCVLDLLLIGQNKISLESISAENADIVDEFSSRKSLAGLNSDRQNEPFSRPLKISPATAAVRQFPVKFRLCLI
jgi:hypothetical protein